jgi:threonine/homoserine/homoserine lactone efflux protein
MPTPHTLAIFAAAVVVFAVVPGPAVLYVVTRSLAQGRTAGVVSALAVASGNLVHVLAATFGLSAVLASSATAFAAVKYLGAGYLIYLGIRTLRSPAADRTPDAAGRPQPLRRVFRGGVVVAVLNPKTALFFLAFLPQFVDPASGPAVPQILLLGLLLVVITGLSDSSYALVSGVAGGWLRRNVGVRRRQHLLAGGAYLTLGVAAALADPRPTSR